MFVTEAMQNLSTMMIMRPVAKAKSMGSIKPAIVLPQQPEPERIV